jgi:Pentapeptide repeats (8 copies)
MTVRDWLDLLIVPLALLGIGLVFQLQQNTIEQRRAEAERELAEQRAQDEALQTYLSQMGTLLLEKDLRDSARDSEARTLARARTLTALGRLDSEHNGGILQFLREAQLISRTDPVIRLNRSNLRDANLGGVDLNNVDLSEAYLSEAYLSNAFLFDAYLSRADLKRADLSPALLRGADLSHAKLSNANLRGAILSDAYLGYAYLGYARGVTNEGLEQQAKSLEGATMPNGQKYEEWLKDRESRKKGG